MFYMDTSALLKRLRPERGTDYVMKLVDRAERGEIKMVSSSWLLLECLSAIQSWLARGWITREERNTILRRLHHDFSRWVDMGCFIFMEIRSPLLLDAAVLIVKHSMEPGDALHLATALAWRDQVEALITSDKHLKRAAMREGLKVIDPEERGSMF